MYHLLLYETVDRFTERRAPHREAHLEHVRAAREARTLLLAGAFAPVDGAALLFRTGDRALIERFAESDPYVQAGLVTAWRVRRWDVVVDALCAP